MHYKFSAICLCLIVFGFSQAIHSQDQLTTPAAPGTSSPRRSSEHPPKEGLSNVRILAHGESVANPTPATDSAAEPSLFVMGLTFLETGRNEDAVETLLQAVAQNPNDAAAYGKLGVAYESLGRYKEAVVVLKMAIRIKPEIIDAQDYYHLSRAYTALEKFPLAVEAIKLALYIRRAEQVNSDNKNISGVPMAELHYSAGLALYNLHKFREATEELNQVVTLNPKHAPGHFGLALTFLATGDRKGAQKQQDVLESLDPVYAARLAKLLAMKADPQQGLVFVFKVNP